MKFATGQSTRLLVRSTIGPALVVLVICVQGCSSDPTLESWHRVALTEKLTADISKESLAQGSITLLQHAVQRN